MQKIAEHANGIVLETEVPPVVLALTEDERVELAELNPMIQVAFNQHVVPLQAAVQGILRVAERRLKMERGSIGKTHHFDLQTGEVIVLDAPGVR